MVISYWDFWMAIVLIEDFAGDWDRLVARLRHDLSGLSFRHYAAEGVLNHLLHLRQSLQESGLTAHDILAATDPANIKKQKAKARHQILEATPSDREKSYWMLHTPRAEREMRARRGYWDRVSGITCPLRRRRWYASTRRRATTASASRGVWRGSYRATSGAMR